MKFQQERRQKLDEQTREFKARRSNFRQFIIENVNKIRRQHEVFKTMRTEQVQCREVLDELTNATRAMKIRSAELLFLNLAIISSDHQSIYQTLP